MKRTDLADRLRRYPTIRDSVFPSGPEYIEHRLTAVERDIIVAALASPSIEGQAGGGVDRPISDLPAVRLVDWAYLYATEGGGWPDQNTVSEHLIALADRRAPTQADADMLKAGSTLKALLALDDADLPTANDVRGILGPVVSPHTRWTGQDIAEAKSEATALHEYFHPPVADRAAVIEAALLEIAHLPDAADLHEAVLIALRALPNEDATQPEPIGGVHFPGRDPTAGEII